MKRISKFCIALSAAVLLTGGLAGPAQSQFAGWSAFPSTTPQAGWGSGLAGLQDVLEGIRNGDIDVRLGYICDGSRCYTKRLSVRERLEAEWAARRQRREEYIRRMGRRGMPGAGSNYMLGENLIAEDRERREREDYFRRTGELPYYMQ